MGKCKCSNNTSCVCQNNIQLDEHIKKILEKSNYIINEAKYSLIDNIEEDDNVPQDIWVGPKPVTNLDSSIFEDNEEIEDEEQTDNQVQVDDPDIPQEIDQEQDVINQDQEEIVNVQTQEKSADQIQNDIIKLNISAMQKMQKVVNDLGNTVDSLNVKVGELSSDVEEVREPTNVEKLVNKKEDSHPYYYNLDDMWKGNSFQARKNMEQNQGIIKLDDGSYIADFDNLPKHSNQEIIDSLKRF